MSQGLSYCQRLVLRDLLREGPCTTDKLASWWYHACPKPVDLSEDGQVRTNPPRLDFHNPLHFQARQGLYHLQDDGLISIDRGAEPPCSGYYLPRWVLTPRGEQLARRIDDELGKFPAENLRIALK